LKNARESVRFVIFLSKTIGSGLALLDANKKACQNVAQSCLHQQVCNPHSYVDNYEVIYEENLIADAFTNFKVLPSITLHNFF